MKPYRLNMETRTSCTPGRHLKYVLDNIIYFNCLRNFWQNVFKSNKALEPENPATWFRDEYCKKRYLINRPEGVARMMVSVVPFTLILDVIDYNMLLYLLVIKLIGY